MSNLTGGAVNDKSLFKVFFNFQGWYTDHNESILYNNGICWNEINKCIVIFYNGILS